MKIRNLLWTVALGAAIAASSGCNNSEGQAGSDGGFFGGTRITVPSGTGLDVRLAQSISSETAHTGDPWRGIVTSAVEIDGHEVIPAGSTVEGVVVAAKEARRGDRAKLELGVRAIRIGDRRVSLRANAEPVIAGSTRARNLGAIAGGAAAGALLGKAIGGDGGDATRGAIVGGAVATGAVAASKGYQVVLKDGTVMTFVVNQNVAVSTG
jgi:hypothetical protein